LPRRRAPTTLPQSKRKDSGQGLRSVHSWCASLRGPGLAGVALRTQEARPRPSAGQRPALSLMAAARVFPAGAKVPASAAGPSAARVAPAIVVRVQTLNPAVDESAAAAAQLPGAPSPDVLVRDDSFANAGRSQPAQGDKEAVAKRLELDLSAVAPAGAGTAGVEVRRSGKQWRARVETISSGGSSKLLYLGRFSSKDKAEAAGSEVADVLTTPRGSESVSPRAAQAVRRERRSSRAAAEAGGAPAFTDPSTPALVPGGQPPRAAASLPDLPLLPWSVPRAASGHRAGVTVSRVAESQARLPRLPLKLRQTGAGGKPRDGAGRADGSAGASPAGRAASGARRRCPWAWRVDVSFSHEGAATGLSSWSLLVARGTGQPWRAAAFATADLDCLRDAATRASVSEAAARTPRRREARPVSAPVSPPSLTVGAPRQRSARRPASAARRKPRASEPFAVVVAVPGSPAGRLELAPPGSVASRSLGAAGPRTPSLQSAPAPATGSGAPLRRLRGAERAKARAERLASARGAAAASAPRAAPPRPAAREAPWQGIMDAALGTASVQLPHPSVVGLPCPALLPGEASAGVPEAPKLLSPGGTGAVWLASGAGGRASWPWATQPKAAALGGAAGSRLGSGGVVEVARTIRAPAGGAQVWFAAPLCSLQAVVLCVPALIPSLQD